MDELQERLVKRIRLVARRRRVQLTSVPDHADVSRSHFWDVMAGRKSPSLKWLGKVAAALEVDAADLLAPMPKR